MVRADNNLRAITYARKYLAAWGATHMKELQRVMATLAFKSNTECATYKVNCIDLLTTLHVVATYCRYSDSNSAQLLYLG